MKSIKKNSKPEAKVIGRDSNVFTTLGICSQALQDANQPEKDEEMTDRVFNAKSYYEALNIMREYVQFTGK